MHNLAGIKIQCLFCFFIVVILPFYFPPVTAIVAAWSESAETIRLVPKDLCENDVSNNAFLGTVVFKAVLTTYNFVKFRSHVY